jgi:hypothetical protein
MTKRSRGDKLEKAAHLLSMLTSLSLNIFLFGIRACVRVSVCLRV